MTELANGLKYTDTTVGTGAEAKRGEKVTVHYTGWLYNNGEKGKKFDSSVDRGEPFTFNLGGGQVIPGWDHGVAGMKVGGKRTLIIPPESRLRRARRRRRHPAERHADVRCRIAEGGVTRHARADISAPRCGSLPGRR